MLREYDWQQTMDSYILVHYTRSHALFQMNGESIAPSHALKFPPLEYSHFQFSFTVCLIRTWFVRKKIWERSEREKTCQCPSQWLRDLRECQSVVGWHTPLYHRLRQSPVPMANTTRSFDEFDEYGAKKNWGKFLFFSCPERKSREKNIKSNRKQMTDEY